MHQASNQSNPILVNIICSRAKCCFYYDFDYSHGLVLHDIGDIRMTYRDIKFVSSCDT